jgi:TPR repeat protein
MVTVRRLLTDRAENGQADAAYELALTYDVEVLARAGIETIEGDMLTARAWYMRAAQAGHAGATRRLEMIARRPAGA